MTLRVEYIHEYDFAFTDSDEQRMNQLLTKALEMEGRANGEVSITFCDNARIQEINREFRGIDKATDVLSFPMEEDELLGDIIISIPKAREQAIEYGHSFERELHFLALHGFLHLLGYDHETEEQEKKMFSRQDLILTEMGINR